MKEGWLKALQESLRLGVASCKSGVSKAQCLKSCSLEFRNKVRDLI